MKRFKNIRQLCLSSDNTLLIHNKFKLFLLYLIIIVTTFVTYPQNSFGQANQSGNLSTPDKINQAIGDNAVHPFSTTAQGILNISITNNLLSGKIEHSSLPDIFKNLSELSGVPIIILDPKETKSIKVSLSLDGVKIQEAVKKVMDHLPSGGFSSVTGAQGKDVVDTIYVITKKGTDILRADTDRFMDRIKKGERPAPHEVASRLESVFLAYGRIAPEEAALYVLPIVSIINEDYKRYKQVVLSLLFNQEIPSAMRAAMIEIIQKHWDDPDSKVAVNSIFMNTAESPMLLGRSATTLASRGVNIGDELMRRYESANYQTKPYYAKAFSYLGRKEAIPLLRSDLETTENLRLKATIIRSLGRIDPDNAEVAEVLDRIVYAASAKQRPPGAPVDINLEVLSIKAVLAIAESKKPQTPRRLVEIANDDTLPVDVRLTSLEFLRRTPREKMTETIASIEELQKRIKDSKALSEVNKERFSDTINRILTKNPPPKP